MAWDFKTYRHERQMRTELGDIAVCQEFSNYKVNPRTGEKAKRDGKDVDNLYIRIGQAIGSWMIKSSSNSEHAAIVLVGWDSATLSRARICDANVLPDENDNTVTAIARRKWMPRPAYIYRCNVSGLRNEAANVAGCLADKVKSGAVNGGSFDWVAARNSVPKFKYTNAESNKFVDNCYAVAYDDPTVGNTSSLPGMFCSEFVTVCYLLAARRKNMNLGNKNVDPRAISPKALQSLLERSNLFSRIGRPFCDGT